MTDANLEAVLAHAEFKALEKERDEYLTIAGERADQVTALSETVEELRTEIVTLQDASLLQTHEYFRNKYNFEQHIDNLQRTNKALQATAADLQERVGFWIDESTAWAGAFAEERRWREGVLANRARWKDRAKRATQRAWFWCILTVFNWVMIALYLWANR